MFRAAAARSVIAVASALLLVVSVASAQVPDDASRELKHQRPAAEKPTKKKRSKTDTAKPAEATRKPVVCTPIEGSPGLEPMSVWRDCADTPEMVTMPGGSFLMGELGETGLLYERPIREVQIKPFAMGRYEVTFIEWDDCHAAGFCMTRPDDKGWGRGFHPVINVTWVDAQQYVAWLSRKTGQSYRLPTEAEWEYAARAGTTSSFPWGESLAATCDYANAFDISGHNERPNWFWSVFCVDGYAYTAPVGSFPPNPWGLYDMQGNVWEWTQDCWHSDYTGAPTDGSAWISGGECEKRVNRGGGWGNHPRTLRVAKRDADSATGYGDAFGFRVVRDLPAPPDRPPGERPATTEPDLSPPATTSTSESSPVQDVLDTPPAAGP
ncbi:formylglycine-generating enzyme required for sulfatase activity [Panacagrimonas perspica]|uniref:Formylglycine-generating enzyme required for sulfatase activity n=1 Tax=Panacagrimonas perspica TaxID=381431 RepID=A0A4R7P3Z2_9GAMM|nr:formylglycine-generating enzyme family protein [Panacagrimonas perspica]TDU28152.1 formylglycine-generating enzyme required for sulfatase activity [Panacagrimonas perspica]